MEIMQCGRVLSTGKEVGEAEGEEGGRVGRGQIGKRAGRTFIVSVHMVP